MNNSMCGNFFLFCVCASCGYCFVSGPKLPGKDKWYMAFSAEITVNDFVCDVVWIHCGIAKEAVDLASVHCFTACW